MQAFGLCGLHFPRLSVHDKGEGVHFQTSHGAKRPHCPHRNASWILDIQPYLMYSEVVILRYLASGIYKYTSSGV